MSKMKTPPTLQIRVSEDRHNRIKELSEITGVQIRFLLDRAVDLFLAAHKDEFGRIISKDQ
jgi:hypothetical protein